MHHNNTFYNLLWARSAVTKAQRASFHQPRAGIWRVPLHDVLGAVMQPAVQVRGTWDTRTLVLPACLICSGLWTHTQPMNS
jgi:hypothetical protein